MRYLKRISFLLYSILLFAAGFQTQTYLWDPAPLPEKPAVPALQDSAALTCDTQLVICSIGLPDKKQTEEVLRLPEKYIGMDRSSFVRCIEDSRKAPLLSERKKGLALVEVLSFSPQKLVLRKTYRKPAADDGYYLAVKNHRLVVYEQDRTTCFLQSDIDVRTLPAPLRLELARGKKVDSREALENILVSCVSS